MIRDDFEAGVTPYILNRGEFSNKLINRASVLSTGLQGIPLLRVNNQFNLECVCTLYEENKWVFDT
jgi:hypothetical protein